MRKLAAVAIGLSLFPLPAALAQNANETPVTAPGGGVSAKTDDTIPTRTGRAPVAPGSLGTSHESATGGNPGGATDRN